MRRDFEPVDFIVAIGTCVTVLAAYFTFVSASGIVGAAVPQSGSAADNLNTIEVMEWVQPALGQAIVDDLLVDREASSRIAAAAMKLNRDTLAAQDLQASPFRFLNDIKTQTAAMTEDHAARVQFVMGRSIVDFTARGVRTGVLSSQQPSGPYNRRMIRITEAAGVKMHEEFQRNHQANVGRAIVAAVQNHDRFAGQVQERVAHAVVQVRTTQARYEQAAAGIQEQLAAATVASFLAERALHRIAMRPSLPLTQPRSWPEIPYEVLFAWSAIFIGIFCGVLWMSRTVAESSVEEEVRLEAEGARVYGKTA